MLDRDVMVAELHKQVQDALAVLHIQDQDVREGHHTQYQDELVGHHIQDQDELEVGLHMLNQVEYMDHNLDSLHNQGRAVQLVHKVILGVVHTESVVKHHIDVVGVRHGGVYHVVRYGVVVVHHNDAVVEPHIRNGVVVGHKVVHRVDVVHHNVVHMGVVERG